tara:strand:- start:22 stop:141 length:120 start_codon:yes stop_codon:yes gene_type:complete
MVKVVEVLDDIDEVFDEPVERLEVIDSLKTEAEFLLSSD